MTPESGEELEGDISFTLIQDKIFKDQVSFDVRSTGVYDEMSLKVHPSRLEIKFFPESSDCRRDTSIGEVCSKVREMGTSISKAFRSLHYNEKNLQPVMCLMCGHCSEPHPVEKAKQHYKIHCKSSRRTGRIPVEGRCWFNEDMDDSSIASATISTTSATATTTSAAATTTSATARSSEVSTSPALADLTLLRWKDDKGKTHRFRLLRLISSEWWTAGLMLGMNADELENIKQKTDDNAQRLTLIFTQWINNDGHPPQYPLSWDGVCELLYDLERDSAAEELKQALDKLSLV